MTRFTVKAFGLIAWLVAVMLTIELVREFTQGESVVTIGVAGLAILLSAFGLLFARYSWQQRAYPEIMFGVMMWVAGVGCLAFIELAYWTSNYDIRYERYAQEKTARQRQTGLEDRAWRSLTTGDIPEMPAQIRAKIEAKKLDAAISRSKGCTVITRDDTRRVCQDLYVLEASLAAAEQRLRLEDQIKIALPANGTQIDKLSSNVFAAADIIADARGESPKRWSYLIIFWSWLLVTIVRDAGLLVANPLGRRKEAAQPRKLAAVPDATVRLPRAALTPWIDLARPKTDNGNSREILGSSPPDPDGGQSAGLPIAPEAHQEHTNLPDDKPINVINTDGTPWEPEDKPSKRDLKREKKERLRSQNRAIVERFVNERLETFSPRSQLVLTAKGGHQSGGTPGDHVYTEFKQFCRDVRHPIIGKNHLGVFIGEFVDRAKNAKSVVYGCTVLQKAQTRKRAA